MACGYQEQPFEVEQEHVSYVKNYKVRLQIRVDSINGRYIAREVFKGEKRVQDTLFYYPRNQEEVDKDWRRIIFDKKIKKTVVNWIFAYLDMPLELVRRWDDLVKQPHVKASALKCQLRVEGHHVGVHSDGTVSLY